QLWNSLTGPAAAPTASAAPDDRPRQQSGAAREHAAPLFAGLYDGAGADLLQPLKDLLGIGKDKVKHSVKEATDGVSELGHGAKGAGRELPKISGDEAKEAAEALPKLSAAELAELGRQITHFGSNVDTVAGVTKRTGKSMEGVTEALEKIAGKLKL